MVTEIQVVKERSGREYRKSRRGSLKPAAPSCGGSEEATAAVFTALAISTFCFVAGAKLETQCLAF